MSDTDPLPLSELQKLDDGVYISEVRRNQAGAVVRIKETAVKSWKIAAAVAAVVLAAGFSDQLRQSDTWVQVVGSVAIVAWLITTATFLWVNFNPDIDDPSWTRAATAVEESMAREVADAAGDRVREREVYAKQQNRIALRFHTRRFRIATGWAVLALGLTAVALIATIVGDDGERRRGTLLLTPEGSEALLSACPNLSEVSLPMTEAELDPTNIGVDAPIQVTFEEGTCAEPTMHLFLDGELVLGLVDP